MQLATPYIALLLVAVASGAMQFNLMNLLESITGRDYDDDDYEEDYNNYIGLVQDLIDGAGRIAESIASGFLVALEDGTTNIESRMQNTNGTNLSYRTALDFSRNVILNNIQSVNMILELIHKSFVQVQSDEGMQDAIFDPIAAILQDTDVDLMCKTNQSAQQLVYNIYSSIKTIEQKGFLILEFSYMLLRLYNGPKDNETYTKRAKSVRDVQLKRELELAEVAQKLMPALSREFRRCDPLEHDAGRTYLEITRLLQGHIQNLNDLNSEGSCSGDCEQYTSTKNYGCYDSRTCNKQEPCNGRIVNCKFIGSDIKICPSNSHRRYEYVETRGFHLGPKKKCDRSTYTVESWTRWFRKCDYCFCFCDEQGSLSDRYFNLRPVIANVSNNMVVTGLRFTKVNRVIHLQIQEGKLLPKGAIDNRTLRWVPVESYDLNDDNVINGRDYHTLTWKERGVHLDDLIAEHDEHVLTGVGLKNVGGYLNLQILLTPFDYGNGSLIRPTKLGRWVNDPTTKRTELKLGKTGIPTRAGSACQPDSKSGQYVSFTHTDLDIDAAQTTVPFLDAQPVVPKTAVPLAGAGLYHKGEPRSGGFIAPKIITYDYGLHVERNLLNNTK